MTCKDCIHDGVCHLQEMSTGLEIEEYLKEFGCEDYISNTDLVGVVRCKDCKHWNCVSRVTEHMGCDIFCGAYEREYPTLPDDFCSYGERK